MFIRKICLMSLVAAMFVVGCEKNQSASDADGGGNQSTTYCDASLPDDDISRE